MNATLIGVIITAVLTAAGSAGIWQYVSARRDRDLREQEVKNDTTEAESNSFAVLTAGYAGFMERITSEVGRLTAEVASQGNQIKELREEVRMQASVINKLRSTIRAASAYIDDLHHRWDWHRTQDTPPPKPHLNHDYE